MPAPDLHIRVLLVKHTWIDQGWHSDLRSPYWRLYLNAEDGAAIEGPHGIHPLPAGTVVLVPAWGRFRGRCRSRVSHLYIHFEPIGPAGGLPLSAERPLILTREPVLTAAVQALLPAAPGDPGWRLRAQAAVFASLASAWARLPAQTRDELSQRMGGDSPVDRAIARIEEDPAAPHSVSGLATLCGLSADHFAKVFRARSGRTPSRYLQERRIAAAAERLALGDGDIERAARDSGFANRFHFTRVFTALMGMPPGAYRRQAQLTQGREPG